MKKHLRESIILFTSALIITSCASRSNEPNYYRSSADSNLVASPTAVVYSPANIIIYNEKNALDEPIEEITVIKVNLYNEYGIRRQQALIDKMLKEQAYSLGGNAIILIKSSDKNNCYAKVVHANTKPKT